MFCRSEQARQLYATRKEQAKSIDCSLMSERKERMGGGRSTTAGDDLLLQPQSRSKSSDNVFEQSQAELSLDSNTLKRMLHPLPAGNSVQSSPEQVGVHTLTFFKAISSTHSFPSLPLPLCQPKVRRDM